LSENINKRDALGVTKIFEAVSDDSIELVESLLTQGADPNIPDHNGTTPLMEAASGGNLTIVKLLLNHGAKIDAKDQFGDTAMDYAQKQAFEKVATHLRENAKPGSL
jgi:ankyrin repeat protein